jgi:hypothetical protein
MPDIPDIRDVTSAQHRHDIADRQGTTILGTICQLTDAQAGAVEPAFTKVENRSSRLRRFFGHSPERGFPFRPLCRFDPD